MRRVLLVERELVEHAALATLLRADGCEVVEVAGGEDLGRVVERLIQADQPADLIIADAEESGGPGLDLMIAAHNRLGDPPLILLTQTVDVDLLREADLLEARFVFVLPCEAEALRLANRALSIPARVREQPRSQRRAARPSQSAEERLRRWKQ